MTRAFNSPFQWRTDAAGQSGISALPDGAFADGVVAASVGVAPKLAYDTTQYPWDTIAYITDVINGQEYQASGVLIAPNLVLTASHVLWSTQYGAATNVEVSPGYNAGYAPFGTITADHLNYFQVQDSNDRITTQQSQYDFALIHLSSSFNVGSFGILPDFTGGQVNVTGYPADAQGAQKNSVQTVVPDPYYNLFDGISIGQGSSGGPVWIDGSAGPQVVGVTSSQAGGTGSAGYFAQITNADYHQIQNWVAQNSGGGIPVPVPSNDFNGDGTSDVLFQNTNSGLLLDWQMQNGGFGGSLSIGGATPDWQFQATGDFNGIGVSDILFRNSNSGLLLYWQMFNGTYYDAVPIAATTPDWQVVGTGDFNGDGTSDILFRNTNSGLFLDWQMSGGNYSQASAIGQAAPGWQFLGSGDFNGNGTSDLLFQNSNSGQLLYWQMSGGHYENSVSLAAAGADWKFLATGNFSGNGTDGILFQNTNSGLLLDWQLNNGGFADAIPIASAAPDWKFAGVGDYNGDGTTDILFQNTNSGLLLDWQMNGGHYGQAIVIGGAGADWKLH